MPRGWNCASQNCKGAVTRAEQNCSWKARSLWGYDYVDLFASGSRRKRMSIWTGASTRWDVLQSAGHSRRAAAHERGDLPPRAAATPAVHGDPRPPPPCLGRWKRAPRDGSRPQEVELQADDLQSVITTFSFYVGGSHFRSSISWDPSVGGFRERDTAVPCTARQRPAQVA